MGQLVTPSPQEGLSRNKASTSIQRNPPVVHQTPDHISLLIISAMLRVIPAVLDAASDQERELVWAVASLAFFGDLPSRGAAAAWMQTLIHKSDTPELGRRSSQHSGQAIHATGSPEMVEVQPAWKRPCVCQKHGKPIMPGSGHDGIHVHPCIVLHCIVLHATKRSYM